MAKHGEFRAKNPAGSAATKHLDTHKKMGASSTAAAMALNRRLDKRFAAAERKIDSVLNHQARLRK